MSDKKFDRAVCEDSTNLDKLVSSAVVNLAVVASPSFDLNSESSKKIEHFISVMKKVAKITKPGGICCLILTDEIDYKKGVLVSAVSEIFEKVVGISKMSADWSVKEEIIWVKSSKDSVESLNKMETGVMVNFDQTPFSQILVLEKKGTLTEYRDMLDRISELHLSERKKSEMQESVWFVQPKSTKGYRDAIPAEVVSRLVLIYSEEGDLVVDPFAGDGVTGAVAKTLGRHFLCIDKNEERVKLANIRFKQVK